MKNGNQSWEPRYCCPTCAIELRSASQGNHLNLNFCTPMLWNEPQNHNVDCYFYNIALINSYSSLVLDSTTILTWKKLKTSYKKLYKNDL